MTTTVITTEQARQERGRDDDGREMRRLGRTDLLGLHRDFDYWNPPRKGQPATPALEVAQRRPATTAQTTAPWTGVGDTVGDEEG